MVNEYIQVDSSQYESAYDSKKRFISYWHQIYEIQKLNANQVLEIGIGNGFISKYLKERSLDIITLDVDKRLHPKVLGTINQLPFIDKSFEVVACFEVMEHLPYSEFTKILSEINRVSSSYAIISLPDASLYYRIFLQIPKFGEFREIIQIPRIRKQKHEFDGEHYWELGKSGYSLVNIIDTIKKQIFSIEKTYRIFENPYHRFFVLKKCN
jgi:SAM-dependent methyltransferase